MDLNPLRDWLQGQMTSRPNGNVDNPSFWYPLAVATYGVDEVVQAVESMITYRTTMWEKTRIFEDMFGDKYGAEAVMVNSGSSADLLMVFANLLQSGGSLSPGDEVCLPAVTWPTHLWSVLMAGLKPVLIDVDPQTLNMSIEDLKSKVNPRTKAIFPVHLMGNPADMDSILDVADHLKATVMEDCCEALGAKWDGRSVGSFSAAGSFSFFFSHHITTMEGGMILTGDPQLAERLRLLRAHGWSRNLRKPETVVVADGDTLLDPRYTFVEWGFNVRPTELQAGFGIEQLKRVGEFEIQRQYNFNLFRQLLSERSLTKYLKLPTAHEKADPSWFALPMLVDASAPCSRDDLTAYLGVNGVESRPVVAGNLARHPVRHRFPEVFGGSYPGADIVHNQGLYIGLYPFPMEEVLVRAADLLEQFFDSRK